MKQGVGGTFAALASIFSLLGKLIYIIKHMPCTCMSFCHRVHMVSKRPCMKKDTLKISLIWNKFLKNLEFLQEPVKLNFPEMWMWQKSCQAQIWVYELCSAWLPLYKQS